MSETQHTAGPWEIDGTGSIIRTATGINERERITGGYLVGQFFGKWGPNKADAALIVAAPDLLAALKGLLNVAVWDDETVTQEEFMPAADAALAAIAKATGTPIPE